LKLRKITEALASKGYIGLTEYVYYIQQDTLDSISKDQSRLLNVKGPEIENSKLWIKTKADGSRELNVVVKFYNRVLTARDGSWWSSHDDVNEPVQNRDSPLARCTKCYLN
jgi:hypothetical protein